ncbi:hypothetical protein BS78_05G284200 [Paspalum vaginatum]|nr:hypothetical protein BS78_05G284200 [Paspalum vaginatum]
MVSPGPGEAIAISLAAIIIPCLAYNWFCPESEEEADDDDTADLRRPPAASIGGGSVVAPPPWQQPPVPVAVEMPPQWKEWPAVVMCTYRRADGWPEAACAVCLAELDDGVSVRVLPVCMHYFHAGCVGEWLRAHRTCPLCRAPLDPALVATA